jgi:hypothetical protein
LDGVIEYSLGSSNPGVNLIVFLLSGSDIEISKNLAVGVLVLVGLFTRLKWDFQKANYASTKSILEGEK